jgi:alkylhydroperoxidase family enzyme
LVHHLEAARKAGVSDAKLAALEPGGDLDALSPQERCAVEYARQSAQSRTCDAETFSRLQEYFGPEGLIDLVVTSAWYHLCAVILDSTEIGLEPEYGGSA